MNKAYKLFDNKAELYAANRPSYSQHVLKYMQEDMGFASTALGADVGCGTGQLTKILAGYFDFLYAVEPNDSMIRECKKYLRDYQNIQYIHQCAEDIRISNNALNYITVAQAFHLFHSSETLQEFKRTLKPEGYLIIIYNMKNHSSELFLKNEEVLLKNCPLYKRDIHAMEFSEDSFRNCFTEDSYQYRHFPNDNTEYLDRDTFINRTLSASYALQAEDPSFFMFVDELNSVFDEFSLNQIVKMELSTVIFSGHLR